MRIIYLLLLLAPQAFCVYTEDQLAEISYYDSNGKIKVLKLPYYIDTNKIQYGVKFGVTVYKIPVIDCAPSFSEEIEEYFAAYLELPSECDATEIIKETDNHGADFIFVDLRNQYDIDKLLTNKYLTPVFFMENSHQEDFFNFNETINFKRYINIFFTMVILLAQLQAKRWFKLCKG